MGKIVLPLAKNGFISGFMLTFISIAKELDLIIIMMDKHTQTMSYLAPNSALRKMPSMLV